MQGYRTTPTKQPPATYIGSAAWRRDRAIEDAYYAEKQRRQDESDQDLRDWLGADVFESWDAITADDLRGDAPRDALSPGAHEAEQGNEPVREPSGERAHLLDQHGEDAEHAAVPSGHHRIDWDSWTPHVPKVVHKVFFELPLPPSEVWTDREWTFWPMRSKPHYDLEGWEQIARSILDSALMSVGLKFLNAVEETGRASFSEDDLPVVEQHLMQWAMTGKDYYRNFWWDEAVVVGQPGLGSLKEAKRFYAGRRLPMGLLRASAARTAYALIVQAEQPHRVETATERAAWRTWLKKPYGAPPLRIAAVPTTYDLDYFSIHGKYPPIWRPRAVAFAERQSMLGRISGEKRQPDRSVLLRLTVGLTVPETVEALAGLGMSVTTKTVTNWRRWLMDTGVVQVGAEPWRTDKGRPKRCP